MRVKITFDGHRSHPHIHVGRIRDERGAYSWCLQRGWRRWPGTIYEYPFERGFRTRAEAVARKRKLYAAGNWMRMADREPPAKPAESK